MSENKTKLEHLDGALDKVAKKQKVSYTKTLQQVDFLISEVNKCKLALNLGSIG
jgi:hypothetical protein